VSVTVSQIRAVIIGIHTFAVAATLLNAENPNHTATEQLDGVWVAEKVLSAGQLVPKEKFPFELHFNESQLTFKFVGQNTQGKDRVHQISIDTSNIPATIDITRTMGDRKLTVLGIFKFEGGKLVICSLRGADGNPSTVRPETFESSHSVRSDVLILKRQPDPDTLKPEK
jgi:uncharacterized protein (TIGR03067 family)